MKKNLMYALFGILSFLGVLTSAVSINFQGLEALTQLYFAILAIALPIGIILIVLVIVDRYTDGAVRSVFGAIF